MWVDYIFSVKFSYALFLYPFFLVLVACVHYVCFMNVCGGSFGVTLNSIHLRALWYLRVRSLSTKINNGRQATDIVKTKDIHNTVTSRDDHCHLINILFLNIDYFYRAFYLALARACPDIVEWIFGGRLNQGGNILQQWQRWRCDSNDGIASVALGFYHYLNDDVSETSILRNSKMLLKFSHIYK